MTLQELANLVLVRNQLVLLLGSRSTLQSMGISKEDYNKLDKIRGLMDKKLLEGCLKFEDTSAPAPYPPILGDPSLLDGGVTITTMSTSPNPAVFLKATTASGTVKAGISPTTITPESTTAEPKQLSLPLDQPKKKPGRKPKTPETPAAEMTQEEKDKAEIAKRIAEAKAAIPKNSFKRAE